MARPYKIPNKSSAIDIILAGARGALSGALTVEQQRAQAKTAQREFDLKIADLELRREQMSQEWDIARFNAEQAYKNMIAKQEFDTVAAKEVKAKEEALAAFDFKQKIAMSIIDDEEQEVRDVEKRKFDEAENAKDRASQEKGYALSAEKLGFDVETTLAKMGMDVKNARVNWLDKLISAENRGGTEQKKLSDFSGPYDVALKEYAYDREKNNKRGMPITAANLVARSLEYALALYHSEGTRDGTVYVYDYDEDKNAAEKGIVTPITLEYYLSPLTKEEQDKLLSDTDTAKSPAVQKLEEEVNSLLGLPQKPTAPAARQTAPAARQTAPAARQTAPAARQTAPADNKSPALPTTWDGFVDKLNSMSSDWRRLNYIKDNIEEINRVYNRSSYINGTLLPSLESLVEEEQNRIINKTVQKKASAPTSGYGRR